MCVALAELTARPAWVVAVVNSAAFMSGAAQGRPSITRFDGRRILQRTDTFAQYMISTVEHDTVRAGNIIETVRADGDSLIRIVLDLEDSVLRHADTLVSTLSDLSPVSHASHQRTAGGVVRFRTGRAKGWLRLENGDTIAIDSSLPTATYNAADFDLLIRGSDLQEGTRVELAGFSLYSNSIVPLRGRITGTEIVEGRPCWVFKGTNGTTPVTFWIDQGTRELRRQLIQGVAGYQHLKTNRPAGEKASLTEEERSGMVLDSTGLRHPVLDFVVPLPSQDFEPYEDMDDALRKLLGRRLDVFVWAYHIPGDRYFGGVAVSVQKGFEGTEEEFLRVNRDVLGLGRTGKEASYRDSVVWNTQQREYLVVSTNKDGGVSRARCIPSPESRKPGLIVCVLLAGGFPSQTRPILEGLRFTATGP